MTTPQPVPYRFKLAGKTWVVYQNLAPIEGVPSFIRGRCFPDKRAIDLYAHRGNWPAQRAFVFWHEAAHAILSTMTHKSARRLFNDEAFVDEFAARLNELIKTSRI